MPAKCRVISAPCCAGKGCTARTSRTGAGNWRPANTRRSPPKRRGPKPDLGKAESRRNEALEREVTRLRRQLDRAEQIIEAQKKLCELLGVPTGEAPPR